MVVLGFWVSRGEVCLHSSEKARGHHCWKALGSRSGPAPRPVPTDATGLLPRGPESQTHTALLSGDWALTYFLWPILLLRYFPTLELMYSFLEPSRPWGLGTMITKRHLYSLHTSLCYWKEWVFQCASLSSGPSLSSQRRGV